MPLLSAFVQGVHIFLDIQCEKMTQRCSESSSSPTPNARQRSLIAHGAIWVWWTPRHTIRTEWNNSTIGKRSRIAERWDRDRGDDSDEMNYRENFSTCVSMLNRHLEYKVTNKSLRHRMSWCGRLRLPRRSWRKGKSWKMICCQLCNTLDTWVAAVT